MFDLFIAGLSGLPGLSGFVGEFMGLAGAFAQHPGLVAVSAVGLIVTVGYFLLMIQRVLLGTVNPKCVGLSGHECS